MRQQRAKKKKSVSVGTNEKPMLSGWRSRLQSRSVLLPLASSWRSKASSNSSHLDLVRRWGLADSFIVPDCTRSWVSSLLYSAKAPPGSPRSYSFQ